MAGLEWGNPQLKNVFQLEGALGGLEAGFQEHDAEKMRSLQQMYQQLQNTEAQLKNERYGQETPLIVQEKGLDVGKKQADQPYWSSNAQAINKENIAKARKATTEADKEQRDWELKQADDLYGHTMESMMRGEPLPAIQARLSQMGVPQEMLANTFGKLSSMPPQKAVQALQAWRKGIETQRSINAKSIAEERQARINQGPAWARLEHDKLKQAEQEKRDRDREESNKRAYSNYKLTQEKWLKAGKPQEGPLYEEYALAYETYRMELQSRGQPSTAIIDGKFVQRDPGYIYPNTPPGVAGTAGSTTPTQGSVSNKELLKQRWDQLQKQPQGK